jgi:hypothetical protein
MNPTPSSMIANLHSLSFVCFVCIYCSSCGDPRLASFAVDHGQTIEITAQSSWEINRAIFYEVRDSAGKVITPRTFFSTDNGDDQHHYVAVFAEHQQLVGILETHADGRDLIIMQDLRTGDSWPRGKDDEVSYGPDASARGRALFNRLKIQNPDLPRPDCLRDNSPGHEKE